MTRCTFSCGISRMDVINKTENGSRVWIIGMEESIWPYRVKCIVFRVTNKQFLNLSKDCLNNYESLNHGNISISYTTWRHDTKYSRWSTFHGCRNMRTTITTTCVRHTQTTTAYAVAATQTLFYNQDDFFRGLGRLMFHCLKYIFECLNETTEGCLLT